MFHEQREIPTKQFHKIMSHFAAIRDFMTKLINWAAACFVLVLLYTLAHESFSDNSQMTNGLVENTRTVPRYPITFGNRSSVWDRRTVKEQKPPYLENSVAGTINFSLAYTRDGGGLPNFEKNDLPEKAVVLKGRSDEASQLSPNLLQNEKKRYLKSLPEEPPPNDQKFSHKTNSQDETIQRISHRDGQFAADNRSERNENPNVVLSNPRNGNTSRIKDYGNRKNNWNKKRSESTEVTEKNKKFESQVNTTQELPPKPPMSMPTKGIEMDADNVMASLMIQTSAISRNFSMFPGEIESDFLQEYQKSSSRSFRDGVIGDDLYTTPCDDDSDCALYNYDLAQGYGELVSPARCDKSEGAGNGTCTCGDLCVSKSRQYTDSKVYYYCGPCGRIGASCSNDENSCDQSNVYCNNYYCTCTQGEFYDLYYCVYNFTGYEKALQVAISICIGVAILLLVVTICGARQRARGGGELSPYLMRLLLRRANEGTRESPPGDVPPSYEDVMNRDKDELPSYEDAVGAATDRRSSASSQQDEPPEGKVNYGFQMTEEETINVENKASKNLIRNLQPTARSQEMLSECSGEIKDDPLQDVKISIAEANESSEDDEFNQFYELSSIPRRRRRLNDNEDVKETRYGRPVGREGQEYPDEIVIDFGPEKIQSRSDNPNVVDDGCTHLESYIHMDPSTGAIPKQRSKGMQEHLDKLKRGPKRKLKNKEGVQNERNLTDSSSNINPLTNPASGEEYENNFVKPDISLEGQINNYENPSSSSENWTHSSNDEETYNESINKCTEVSNVYKF